MRRSSLTFRKPVLSFVIAACLACSSPTAAQVARETADAVPAGAHLLRPKSSVGAEPGRLLGGRPSTDDSRGAGLLGTLQTDLQSFASSENLLWLGVGAGVSLVGHSADAELTRSASESRQLGTLFGPGEAIGGALAQFGGAGPPMTPRCTVELFRLHYIDVIPLQGHRQVVTRLSHQKRTEDLASVQRG